MRRAVAPASPPPRRHELFGVVWRRPAPPAAQPAPQEAVTTPPSAATHRLEPGLLPLAGYLLARRLMGRPIDAGLLPALIDVQRSVVESRLAFPLGRSNMRRDIEASHGEAWANGQAGELLTHELLQAWLGTGGDPDQRKLVKKAGLRDLPKDQGPNRNKGKAILGVAAMNNAGAGLCQNFATRVVQKLAPRMRPDDTVEAVFTFSPSVHNWARLHVAASASRPGAIVVGDGWKEGPAVVQEDCAAERRGAVHTVFSARNKSALDLANRIRQAEDALAASPGVVERTAAKAQQRQAAFNQDPQLARKQTFDPKNVLGEHFLADLARARRNLDNRSDPASRLADMASEVAISLGSSPDDAADPQLIADVIRAMEQLASPPAASGASAAAGPSRRRAPGA